MLGERFLPYLFTVLIVFGAAGPLEPATLLVDADGTAPCTTIQSAIDAAVPGEDDVSVRCGRYIENITMRDDVDVVGESPGCTFIDPAALDVPVVTMPDGGDGTVLRGFTVENRPTPWVSGRGIVVGGGTPVITRNVIRGPGADSSSYSAIGIYVSQGEPVISYNVIQGNTACCAGGGIALAYGAGGTVTSNLIVGNAAYYGAGIYGYLAPDSVVANNTIARNEGWVGGGMMALGTGTVANNAVVFNSAVIYGGGITDWSQGTSFENNNVFGNTPEDYSTLDLTGTNGNISADPEFVNERADCTASFQPRSFSPMVDAASPTWSPDEDVHKIARPVDGNADSVAVADIGARENEGVTGLHHDGIEFVWDPGLHEPPDYNIYRGDLATLKQSGAYTQNPQVVNGARHFCDYSNRLADSDVPDSGRAFFYLCPWPTARLKVPSASTATARSAPRRCSA
jgi:hypothetical protein